MKQSKKLQPKNRVCGNAFLYTLPSGFTWSIETSAISVDSNTHFTQKGNCKRSMIHFARRFGIDIMKTKEVTYG